MLRPRLLRFRPAVRPTVIEDVHYADGPPDAPELMSRAGAHWGWTSRQWTMPAWAMAAWLLWEATLTRPWRYGGTCRCRSPGGYAGGGTSSTTAPYFLEGLA
jgi:hypothetical protein